MLCRKLLKFLPLVLILASCSRDPRAQAQRYVDNGNRFFAKGKYTEARIMYRKALQKDLRFGEAYYRLALADFKVGDFGSALRSLQRAVDLQPNNADAIVKLADLYLVASSTADASRQKQALNEVKDLTDRLFKLDANSFDGHRILGQMALMNKDAAGAVKEFEKANAAKPFQPDLARAYFVALAANNQVPDAEKLARDMIAKDKTYAPIYDLLYLQYMRTNRAAEAEQVLKLKCENNPKSSTYLLQLAQHYYLLNRHDEMDATIAKLTDEKAHPDGHLLAGDFFFFRARQFDKARQQYEAAMHAFPKDKGIYQKRMVELYANTGKSQEANQLLAELLKDNPKDTDAIAMRAALMLTTGNRDHSSAPHMARS